jgi:hypothetical protein
MHGGGGADYTGTTAAIPSLGVPRLTLNDGRQGFRPQGGSKTNTAFPAAIQVVASWDARRMRDFVRSVAETPFGRADLWPLPNVWLGVSAENQATADERIPLLLKTPAAKRFVSYEPALGPVNFEALGLCRDYRDGTRGLGQIYRTY